jgi:CRISPR-associated endoribonuclease Cas6
MHYYEIDIFVDLKSRLHFQKSPEAIFKLISTGLIKGGYKEHDIRKVKHYVFSNLGKAKNNYYQNGKIQFRTFDKNLAKILSGSLMFYEDNIFKIKNLDFRIIKYMTISKMISLNPVFVKMKKTGRFWTFNESGDIGMLFEALQSNLLRKYESFFKEKLHPTNSFIEYIRIKNNTPQTFYFKKGKLFGNKFYIVPRMDEVSQKLAFTALACGLGHLNSTVGGGFMEKLN